MDSISIPSVDRYPKECGLRSSPGLLLLFSACLFPGIQLRFFGPSKRPFPFRQLNSITLLECFTLSARVQSVASLASYESIKVVILHFCRIVLFFFFLLDILHCCCCFVNILRVVLFLFWLWSTKVALILKSGQLQLKSWDRNSSVKKWCMEVGIGKKLGNLLATLN